MKYILDNTKVRAQMFSAKPLTKKYLKTKKTKTYSSGKVMLEGDFLLFGFLEEKDGIRTISFHMNEFGTLYSLSEKDRDNSILPIFKKNYNPYN